MPKGTINPLVKLAKLMPSEIDKFARKYDLADDKKAFCKAIGDLHNLPPEKKHLYAKVTLAVGITDDVYNDCMIHMFNNHSKQDGVNHTGDSGRLYAMCDYIVQAYIDVSRSLVTFHTLVLTGTMLWLCKIRLYF